MSSRVFESGSALRRRIDEPVVAAIGLQRDEQEEQHLREGERDHDELHAARAQAKRAEQRAQQVR